MLQQIAHLIPDPLVQNVYTVSAVVVVVFYCRVMIIGLGLLPLKSSALKFKDTPLPSSLTDTPGLESPLPLPLGFLFYFNIFLDFILAILIPHNGIIYIRNAPQKERQKGRSVHNDGLWHLRHWPHHFCQHPLWSECPGA